jgi:hypothetical protein
MSWSFKGSWAASSLLLLHALGASPTAAQAACEPGDWQARYAQAREQLLSERCSEAADTFRALELCAASESERVRAAELSSLARAQCSRTQTAAQPALRTTDELTLLYTVAVMYGLGTSTWLALQVQPKSFGTALLPFAVITPATVAAVALADDIRPLRHGVPQSIAAGLYLGLGEGVWLTGYQHAYARHHGQHGWSAERVSSALWIASSAGAALGGVVGAWRRPTPGRVSFTASTAIWGGLLSALAANALITDKGERRQDAFVVGSMGYNAGLVAGLLFGPSIAPSVARVRIADLSGLFAGLAVAGGYALVARHRDMRVGFGAGAVGSALGLGIAWWATSEMPPDRSHDHWLSASVQPIVAPTPGGVLAGVAGTL